MRAPMISREQLDVEYDAMAEDAALTPGDNAIGSVRALAIELVAAEHDISFYENKLTEAKARKLELTDKLLPARMTEVGMAEFVMTDGSRVVVKPIVQCGVRKGEEETAAEWLRAHGHGDLLRVTITAVLGKKVDPDLLLAVEAAIMRLGATPERKEAVHPSTLKKFYRELTEQGEDLPEEVFSTYRAQRAELSLTKNSKKDVF